MDRLFMQDHFEILMVRKWVKSGFNIGNLEHRRKKKKKEGKHVMSEHLYGQHEVLKMS